MGLEDESSDGGGGLATVLPGRRRSALSGSLWQQAAAEGAAAAAGTPPVRMASSHGLALSDSLRFLRGQLREFLRECAAAGVEVTMYDAGERVLYPTEHWTVHFFKSSATMLECARASRPPPCYHHQVNTRLTNLDLGDNDVALQGCQALAAMLGLNTTLARLGAPPPR